MRFVVRPVQQRPADARLADPRVAAQQRDLEAAFPRDRPKLAQAGEFRRPPDQLGQVARAGGVEPAFVRAFVQHPPDADGFLQALDLVQREVLVDEHVAEQLVRAVGHQHGVGLGQGLQPRRQVGRLANDRLLLRRAAADRLANHDHQAGGDTDPHAQCDAVGRVELGDFVDDFQPDLRGALRVVFMRLRIAEIGQDAVAHEAGDIAGSPGNGAGTGILEIADHLAEILGIQPVRHRCGAYQIAEQHGQMPPPRFHRRGVLQGGNGAQQTLAVPQQNAHARQIGLGQVGQDIHSDTVIGEPLGAMGQSDFRQPAGYFTLGGIAHRAFSSRLISDWMNLTSSTIE